MLSLMLELRLVLKAIVAREAARQLAALPVIEDASDVLACNAGHGGKVGLPDLLTDDLTGRTNFGSFATWAAIPHLSGYYCVADQIKS